MKVFVFGNSLRKTAQKYVEELIHILSSQKFKIYIYDQLFRKSSSGTIRYDEKLIAGTCSNYEELKQLQPDLVITLGGDGTILKAVTLIRELGIPILGINLGRMGFLASTEKTQIREAVQMFTQNRYKIDTREMICIESNLPLFGNTKFGLNDFTIHKRDTSSMITIHIFIDGEFLNSYWADGVIISTPTGSTGYSLSCGGPIIMPNSDNLVITPVAPHNLTVRPLVIPDSCRISFKVEGRTNKFLCTLDSRFETISTKHEIAVVKCPFQTRMIQLESKTFFNTINDKLNWGKDKRTGND